MAAPGHGEEPLTVPSANRTGETGRPIGITPGRAWWALPTLRRSCRHAAAGRRVPTRLPPPAWRRAVAGQRPQAAATPPLRHRSGPPAEHGLSRAPERAHARGTRPRPRL